MNKKNTEKANKSTHNLIIISSVIIAFCIAIFVLLLFVPRIKATMLFNDYCEAVEASIGVETIVITDVSSLDELLSSEKGETILTDQKAVEDFLDSFDDILDDMSYSGKRSLKYGGWDIRIRIYVNDKYKEMYAKEDMMYILSDGMCYYFSPEGDDVSEYKDFFNTLEKMLQHEE